MGCGKKSQIGMSGCKTLSEHALICMLLGPVRIATKQLN